MPRPILVTGGAGFIGSHVCKTLANAGYRPVVYDNLARGHRWTAKWGPLEAGDIADGPALRAALQRHRIEAVVHLAAYAYVGESMNAPRAYFRNNLVGSLTLLDAMLDVGVKPIVFSSTCATFGLPHRLPIPDDHPQQPVNPYGESKLAVERALRWYGEAHGLAWVALRYFNAAGADPDGELGEDHDPETHLVPLTIQAALGQRPCVDVYGTDYATPDGTAVRDYIHVSDLADAHVRALGYLFQGGASTAFNLGTGRGYSVREVIREVESVGDTRVPVRNVPRRPGDVPMLVAETTRAASVLGWRPRWSDLNMMVTTAWLWHSGRLGAPPGGGGGTARSGKAGGVHARRPSGPRGLGVWVTMTALPMPGRPLCSTGTRRVPRGGRSAAATGRPSSHTARAGGAARC